MKPETVFKQAHNAGLDIIASMRKIDAHPLDILLMAWLFVCRTTVRKILSRLHEQGLIRVDGTIRRVAGKPRSSAYFSSVETVSTSEQVERLYMEWMLRDDTKPGLLINELDLARQFGVGTSAVREFLGQFRRFGLIEKRPNAGWLFKGFTEDFATELFEIREMFELRSVRAFVGISAGEPIWEELRELRREHVALLGEIDKRFHDFSDLDNRFHRLINSASPNRFIDDFYDIITLIFLFHYQWNIRDERQRIEVALDEHLAYIDGLLARDRRTAEAASRHHLTSARQTLRRAFLAPGTTDRKSLAV